MRNERNEEDGGETDVEPDNQKAHKDDDDGDDDNDRGHPMFFFSIHRRWREGGGH